MTIEPLAVRFTIGTKVVPPKTAAQHRVPLPEAIVAQLMQRDSEAVRRRTREAWGEHRDGGPGLSANLRRKADAEERRKACIAEIVSLLAERPHLRTEEIRQAINRSRDATRTTLAALRKDGIVDTHNSKNGMRTWYLTEVKA